MSDLFAALATGGPIGEGAANLLYAPLIGSWDVESSWHDPDGTSRSAQGTWQFAWILGGLGVQDLLGKKDAPIEERGITIRCYDAAIDAWRVTWMAPRGGEFVSLTGRQIGDEIVHEGSALDGSSLQRWTFSEITSESFHWRGESSKDDGKVWRLDQEMKGRRVSP
jgi:hypothetical protein